MFRRTAHIYDLIYAAIGKDYAQEADEIRLLVRERNPTARTLLDVACGTGGHLRHLRDTFEVSGVDLDSGMLDQAKLRLPGVRLVESDMTALDLGEKFDVVVCLFSSVGYMKDTDQLDRAVGSMAAHLNSRGILIVDGWVRPDAWIGDGHTSVDVASDDETKVARVTRSGRDGTRTHLEMHYLIATREQIEHVVETHELTLFAPENYESAFHRAGMTAEVVPSPMPGRDRYVGSKSG
jgi:SAM-dependent methyltransferase